MPETDIIPPSQCAKEFIQLMRDLGDKVDKVHEWSDKKRQEINQCLTNIYRNIHKEKNGTEFSIRNTIKDLSNGAYHMVFNTLYNDYIDDLNDTAKRKQRVKNYFWFGVTVLTITGIAAGFYAHNKLCENKDCYIDRAMKFKQPELSKNDRNKNFYFNP